MRSYLPLDTLPNIRTLVYMGTPAKLLAKLMRQWREDKLLTVADAGERLGLSPRTIEGIEQGRGFSASKVLEIALRHLMTEK